MEGEKVARARSGPVLPLNPKAKEFVPQTLGLGALSTSVGSCTPAGSSSLAHTLASDPSTLKRPREAALTVCYQKKARPVSSTTTVEAEVETLTRRADGFTEDVGSPQVGYVSLC